MESEILYQKVRGLMKKLDKQYAKETKLKADLDKTESLNTYLFSNPPELLKKSEAETKKLVDEICDAVKKLNDLGYAIDGRTYDLIQSRPDGKVVQSAMYGFAVEY